VPHFCMYSGTSPGVAFWAAPSGGLDGVGGGVALDGCVCSSSRATAEVERRRRGEPLALGICRTHRRQALNCRIDGVTEAMAIDGVVDDVQGRRCWKMSWSPLAPRLLFVNLRLELRDCDFVF
jgi:hypothetical protein